MHGSQRVTKASSLSSDPDSERPTKTSRSEVRLLTSVVAMGTRPLSRPAPLPPRPAGPPSAVKPPPRPRLPRGLVSPVHDGREPARALAPSPEVTRCFHPDLADIRLRRSDPPGPAGDPPGADPSINFTTLEGLGPGAELAQSKDGSRSVHDEQTRTYSLDEITRLSEASDDQDALPESSDSDPDVARGAQCSEEDVTVSYHRTDDEVAYCEPHAPPPPTSPGQLPSMGAPSSVQGQDLASPAMVTVPAPAAQRDSTTERRRPRGRRRARLGAWISVGATVGFIGFGLSPVGQQFLDSPPARAAKRHVSNLGMSLGLTRAAPAAPATTPHRAAQAAPVQLSIAVSPPQATLHLDGKPISNPSEIQRPTDERSHELRAEAPGHRTAVRSIRLERDLTIVLELAPLPSEVVSSTVAATPPRRPAYRAWHAARSSRLGTPASTAPAATAVDAAAPGDPPPPASAEPSAE